MSETTMDRDLNLSNFRIKNVGTATDPHDAITKSYFDANRPKMFQHIESVIAGDPSPDGETLIRLVYPTDIYNALIFYNGQIQAPSATDPATLTYEVRDYQIVAFADHSLIQFHTPVPNGSVILAFYNSTTV
jgi:hypothetical protein